MIEANWVLFLLASVVVIATPGQDMILVMSRSLSHGIRAGVTTAAGVSVGLVGHTLLATLGLGALLRTSEWLFTALKFIGAAYLLYLGIQLLLTRAAHIQSTAALQQSQMRLFVTGAVSNISNPKIAVFYFAFLPQFVATGATHPTLTIFALGLLFAALTFVIKGAGGCVRGQALHMVSITSGRACLALSVQRLGHGGARSSSGARPAR